MKETTGFPCPHCEWEIVEHGSSIAACPHCDRPPVVCGVYRVDGVLGQGGMGRIYSGTNTTMGERVVVKMLTLSDSSDWKSTELFERSARVVRGLNHWGVPKVHTFQQDEQSGRLFLVREPFDGGTLEHRIAHDHRRLDSAGFRALFVSMLEALNYLHTLMPPVLHRDIKPSNIMFRTYEDWVPVLVDFDTVADVNQSGGLTIVGTPGYSAPEQFIGDASPRSDLYSLGVTMLFVATHLDPANMPREKGKFALEDRLQALDPTTRRVLLKLVEPDRQDRLISARAALDTLDSSGSKRAHREDRSPRVEPSVVERRLEERRRTNSDQLPMVQKRPDSLPARIREEGWVAQIPKDAQIWAKLAFLIFFFTSMPVSVFIAVGYYYWRHNR